MIYVHSVVAKKTEERQRVKMYLFLGAHYERERERGGGRDVCF